MKHNNLWRRIAWGTAVLGMAQAIALVPFGAKVKAADAQSYAAVHTAKPDAEQTSRDKDEKRKQRFAALMEEAAKAKGVDEADLIDRLLATRLKKIDEAVKSGKWTQEQADQIRAKLPEHLKIIVNHKGEWKHRDGKHHKDKHHKSKDRQVNVD